MLIAASAQSQNLFVSTLSGIIEYTPAGVESTFATGLVQPHGLAFDSAGNLYVGDLSGNIYEYTPGGVQSIFASGAGSPTGLAFNRAGDLFESDHNGNIFEYTPNGVQSTFASGLNQPQGLAFNSAGDLFVSGGNQSGYIYKYTPGGVQSTFTTAVVNPVALAFNRAGNLFEADADDNSVYEFTPGGVRSTFASGLKAPYGLAFNSAGMLFESDLPEFGLPGSTIINEFTPGGSKSSFDTGFTTTGWMAFQAGTAPSGPKTKTEINKNNNDFTGINIFSSLQVTGTVTAASFVGDGSGLANVAASSWYFGIIAKDTVVSNGSAITPQNVHVKGIECDTNGVFTFESAGWYKFDIQLSGDSGGSYYNSGVVAYNVSLGNAVPALERGGDSDMGWLINPDPIASQPYTTSFVQHFNSDGQTCQFINNSGNNLFLGTGLPGGSDLGGRITIIQIDNP